MVASADLDEYNPPPVFRTTTDRYMPFLLRYLLMMTHMEAAASKASHCNMHVIISYHSRPLLTSTFPFLPSDFVAAHVSLV